ncbi:MAG: choice-of-anchor tandem repeat GloVer-containing protein [Rhodospirillales bacterium]
MTKAGVKTLLHSFQGGDDGVNPESGLTNVSGTLYGTTFTGGTSGFGTVFSVTPAGVETVVHSFAYQGAGGAEPVAPLLNVHGVLYGTTQWGGTFGSGTLFRMTTAGDETVLHGFADAEHDGELPSAGLVYSAEQSTAPRNGGAPTIRERCSRCRTSRSDAIRVRQGRRKGRGSAPGPSWGR